MEDGLGTAHSLRVTFETRLELGASHINTWSVLGRENSYNEGLRIEPVGCIQR